MVDGGARGLSMTSLEIFDRELAGLAIEISGEGATLKRIQWAWTLARCLIDLEMVSHVKVALFERMAPMERSSAERWLRPQWKRWCLASAK
jgi:hypothetical protein